jgi:hypothetical protein
MARHDVELTSQQAEALSTLIKRVIKAYSAEILDESLGDLTGDASVGHLEIAAIEGRLTLRSCLAALNGSFQIPVAVGDVDPLAFAVANLQKMPDGTASADPAAVAAAVRRVAQLFGEALAAVTPTDAKLLRSIELEKEVGNRPSAGLRLPRRIIRAVYFFWSQEGGDRTVSITPKTSPLVRVCLASLAYAKLPGTAATVRGEINRYRRVLVNKTEAVGITEERSPEEADFMNPPFDFT